LIQKEESKPTVKKENTKPVEKKEVTQTNEKKEEPIKKVTKTPEKKSSEVEFKIQIAASKKKLSTSTFKGVKNVEVLFIDGYYKYYYGNSPSLSGIKKLLPEVKSNGYKDAWVVAFKNGKRISIKEALKNR